MYHFGVTVTMSSGIISRIIMSRAYTPVLFEVSNQNLNVWICLGVAECQYCIGVTVTLTFGLSSRIIMSRVYPILFEVGIPNGACGCILVWWRVGYHFGVTVTLTSCLSPRIIMSEHIFLYFLRNLKGSQKVLTNDCS